MGVIMASSLVFVEVERIRANVRENNPCAAQGKGVGG
jgi:hypothetical protein